MRVGGVCVFRKLKAVRSLIKELRILRVVKDANSQQIRQKKILTDAVSSNERR